MEILLFIAIIVLVAGFIHALEKNKKSNENTYINGIYIGKGKTNRPGHQGEERLNRLRSITFEKIDKMGGVDFECFIADLMKSMGYQTKVTQSSGDFGIDVIAEKDNIIKAAIQVKRSNHRISRRAVSDAVAGKKYYKCNKAMVITNNYFTISAKDFAESVDCELIDRDVLTEWISTYSSYLAGKEPINKKLNLLGKTASGHYHNADRIKASLSEKEVKVPYLMNETAPEPRQSGDHGEAIFSQKEVKVPKYIINFIKKKARKEYRFDKSFQNQVLEEEVNAYCKLERFSDGRIPNEVLQVVKTNASKAFPDSYSTQLSIIEEQVDSYCKLPRFSDGRIPNEVLKAIKYYVSNECPNDYYTQLITLEENVDSYCKVQLFSDDCIPNEVLQAIKYNASNNYLNDYSMQLYTLKEEVDSYCKIARFSDNRIPNEVLQAIKYQAVKEYPNVYSMQLYTLKEEVDACLTTKNYRKWMFKGNL